MIGFAVFSMLLIGAFRSDVQTQTIPAYQPSAVSFIDYDGYGIIALINNLADTNENNAKIQTLKISLQAAFQTMQIWTNITSDSQLDQIIANQQNDTSHPFGMSFLHLFLVLSV